MAEIPAGNSQLNSQREAARRGEVRTPAVEKGFDVHKLAQTERLPGEFNARQLAGLVQRVAEQAAKTGKVPATEDWMEETRHVNRGIWSEMEDGGTSKTIIGFQKLFLAELSGQDVTQDSKFGKKEQ